MSRRQVAGAWLVTVEGRLTEQFDGTELGRDIGGVVVVDLLGVERVTSFGVREWVLAMADLTGKVEALVLARCSVAVVNQLTMIPGFAGPGVVVSFQAPYQCPACSTAFERAIDGRLDRDALRSKSPPPAPCPRCGEAAVFDDDPGFFRAVAKLVTDRVHPQAEAALRTLAPSDRPAIEKRIEDGGTRLVAHARLEPGIRWSRLLDGIEGELSVEVGAEGAAPTAVAALARALGSLGPEVGPITVHGVPLADGAELAGLLRSVAVEVWCGRCAGLRRVLVTGLEAGTCTRCGDACDVSEHLPRLRELFPGQAAAPRSRSRVPLALAAVVVVGIAAVGFAVVGAAALMGWWMSG